MRVDLKQEIKKIFISILNASLIRQGLRDMLVTNISDDYQTALIDYKGRFVTVQSMAVLEE